MQVPSSRVVNYDDEEIDIYDGIDEFIVCRGGVIYVILWVSNINIWDVKWDENCIKARYIVIDGEFLYAVGYDVW